MAAVKRNYRWRSNYPPRQIRAGSVASRTGGVALPLPHADPYCHAEETSVKVGPACSAIRCAGRRKFLSARLDVV